MKKRYLGRLNFANSNYPTDCLSSVAGNTNWPDELTLFWESPVLYDFNWLAISDDGFEYIHKTVAEGTVLAKRQHDYEFYGDICQPGLIAADDFSPLRWKLTSTKILRLVVRAVVTPVGTFKIPVWEILP